MYVSNLFQLKIILHFTTHVKLMIEFISMIDELTIVLSFYYIDTYIFLIN